MSLATEKVLRPLSLQNVSPAGIDQENDSSALVVNQLLRGYLSRNAKGRPEAALWREAGGVAQPLPGFAIAGTRVFAIGEPQPVASSQPGTAGKPAIGVPGMLGTAGTLLSPTVVSWK